MSPRSRGPVRITIIAIGTHGDVQPLVALGLGLQAAGHTVRLATHAMFETFVRGRGLDFAPVAGEPRALLESPAGRVSLEKSDGVLASGREIIRIGAPQLRRGMADCWQACQDAEAIVVSPLGLLLGYHIAERLCVPL